jgi:hypothetical protein
MFYVNIVVIYFLYLIVCISESLPFALNSKPTFLSGMAPGTIYAVYAFHYTF